MATASSSARQAQTPENEQLLGRLLREPHAFEPGTALRVAEAQADDVSVVSELANTLAVGAISGASGNGARTEIRSVLPGLIGPLGALPPAYADIALKEERRRSRSLGAFLDLFGDALARLFVSAGEKYRLPRLLRWRRVGIDNGISQTLLSLVGLGTGHLRESNSLGDDVALRYAGFFANCHRNASSLRALLQDFSNLPVSIEQFRGRWLQVADRDRTRLGRSRGSSLGVNAMAGAAIRDHSGSFRIVIGPLSYADYLSLQPGSRRLHEIAALTRLYCGPALQFDIQLILRKEDVPQCRLGDQVNPPRLGWNSWARTLPLPHDSDDAVISGNQILEAA